MQVLREIKSTSSYNSSVNEVNSFKAAELDWNIEDVDIFQNEVAVKENLLDKTAKDLNTKEPLVPMCKCI